MTETLILTRREISELVTPTSTLAALREGFLAIHRAGDACATRIPVPLPGAAPEGASGMLLAPGHVPGIPAYSVKVHAKFPTARQALKGVIVLHAIDDGRVLAILESTWLTELRTGFAGALGADVLARRDASRVAIIGAGAQGRAQLECLCHVRNIARARVYDTDPGRARAFAETEGVRLDMSVEPSASVAAAVADADIVAAATWSRTPFLTSGMVRPGTHITTLGPDQPGKAEVAADLIRQSVFVADDIALACRMGAVAGVGLDESAVHASLGAVLAGDRPGRTDDDQITVFGAVGLPFQDMVVAWDAYQSALRRGGGRSVALTD